MQKKEDREIINRGEGYYEVECAVCSKKFESDRYDAYFCSSTCRSRYSRSKNQLQKKIDKAQSALDDLIKILPKVGESRTQKALELMQAQITKALAQVESPHQRDVAQTSHRSEAENPAGQMPEKPIDFA